MKKTLYSLIMWIIVSLCVIIIILYFCGFRITYAPNLENNWDSISACAGWFGAVASAVAIFVAINIPKKIAEQQNKISLFEKRYSVFYIFSFLISVVEQIVNENVPEISRKLYLDEMIETYNSISVVREFDSDCEKKAGIYVRLVFEAGKIQYMFELEEMEIVMDFLMAVEQFISEVYRGKYVDETDLQVAYTKLDHEEVCRKLEAQLKI
ncbi:MAG: hypothetical protein E7261_08410 [Lachnospiraceae bacterium]|nr:hypothetical protein [Lachnospiraceae bacterium]